jgi:restriction system protein
MTIPDYQSIMKPALLVLRDGAEWSVKKMTEKMGETFHLTDDEIKSYLPSGTQTVMTNRTNWALYYLKRAGIVENAKRGVYKITKRGISVLSENPANIDSDYLLRFPEFVDFKDKKSETGTPVVSVVESIRDESVTPEETLEAAHLKIMSSLASDLLEKVYNQTWEFFEQLVIELLVKIGYGGSIKEAGRAIGKTGDEGIDGVIKEDKLGLDIIYIQAKKWKLDSVVGRPEIQKFVGALAGQGAKKGIFMTTSRFTKDALDYTPRNETKVVLIDGQMLSKLMIDYNIGVSTINIFELKKIDNDYFEE